MSSLQPTLGLDLKPTFGWVFIGAMFGGVFYGVTVVQTIFYFQTYPNDSISLKSLVTGIWIVDTLSLIFISHATYTWLVIDFANPLALSTGFPWTIAAEPMCSATIALCVHLFMAYRIYILNHKLVLPAIIIALLSFIPFGVGIAASIIGLITPGGFSAANAKLHSATIVADVFTASLDIVIAATLVMLLRRHTGNQVYLKRTNKMISILTMYLVTNNLLTSVITMSELITSFASSTLAFQAINMVISKVYTNTFLSQLNARQSIRGRGIISNGPTTATKNMEPIAFNLGPTSEGNEGELDFQAADRTTSYSSTDIVQSHVNSEKPKHTHEMPVRDSDTIKGPSSNTS